MDPQESIAIQLETLARLCMAVQNAATECLKYIEVTMKIEFEWPVIKKMKDEMKRLSNKIDDKDWTISF